eukprot:1148122-Pelagomonas_calceolata.AAC.1
MSSTGLCGVRMLQGDRLEEDWVPIEDTRPAEEIEEETRKADAHNRVRTVLVLLRHFGLLQAEALCHLLHAPTFVPL